MQINTYVHIYVYTHIRAHMFRYGTCSTLTARGRFNSMTCRHLFSSTAASRYACLYMHMHTHSCLLFLCTLESSYESICTCTWCVCWYVHLFLSSFFSRSTRRLSLFVFSMAPSTYVWLCMHMNVYVHTCVRTCFFLSESSDCGCMRVHMKSFTCMIMCI